MRCAADRAGRACLVSRCGAIAVCLLGVCVLAACSSAGNARHSGHAGLSFPGIAGSTGRPKIIVPPIPSATSGETISLPLNSYEDVAGLQQTVLAEAQALLTQRCMAARGFVYTSQAAPTPTQEEALLQGIEYGWDVSVTRALWLTISLSDARTYGYGQPAAASGAPPGGVYFGGGISFNDLNRKPPAWDVALLGFAPGARIGRIRQVGCLNLVNNEIYRPGGFQLGYEVPGIAQQAMLWTQTDPRVVAVDAAWSRCMARQGYHYGSPLQPAQHNWPTSPTAAETATAVADVTCKQHVNLTNTWLTVEAAYQNALIGQNIATLSNLQASFQRVLNRVEGLLAGTAGQQPAEVGG